MRTRHKLGTIHGPHTDVTIYCSVDHIQELLEEAQIWEQANA